MGASIERNQKKKTKSFLFKGQLQPALKCSFKGSDQLIDTEDEAHVTCFYIPPSGIIVFFNAHYIDKIFTSLYY